MRKRITGILAAMAACTFVAGQNPGPKIKAVPVEQFGTNATLPLMILLHGVSGPSAFYREQASFFASHGYRVVLPHYMDAGKGQTATDGNYEAWTTAVRNTIDSLQGGHRSPTVIVGYSLGASVASNSLRQVCVDTRWTSPTALMCDIENLGSDNHTHGRAPWGKPINPPSHTSRVPAGIMAGRIMR